MEGGGTSEGDYGGSDNNFGGDGGNYDGNFGGTASDAGSGLDGNFGGHNEYGGANQGFDGPPDVIAPAEPVLSPEEKIIKSDIDLETEELNRQTQELKDQLAAIQAADLASKAAQAAEAQRILQARLRLVAGTSFGTQDSETLLETQVGLTGNSATNKTLYRNRRFTNTIARSNDSNLSAVSTPTFLSTLGT